MWKVKWEKKKFWKNTALRYSCSSGELSWGAVARYISVGSICLLLELLTALANSSSQYGQMILGTVFTMTKTTLKIHKERSRRFLINMILRYWSPQCRCLKINFGEQAGGKCCFHMPLCSLQQWNIPNVLSNIMAFHCTAYGFSFKMNQWRIKIFTGKGYMFGMLMNLRLKKGEQVSKHSSQMGSITHSHLGIFLLTWGLWNAAHYNLESCCYHCSYNIASLQVRSYNMVTQKYQSF